VVTISSPAFTESTAPATLQANQGYFLNGLGTYTLPASAGLHDGDLVEVIVTYNVQSQGDVTIQAAGSQIINQSGAASSPGGQAQSFRQGSALTLRFRVADGSWWNSAPDNGWVFI
jgi:hypothetical protein